MTDAIINVQQRVINEILAGTVRCFGDEPSRYVDFNSYIREYWLCMLMADFANWLGSLQKPEEPLIQSVPATEVIEFGG